MRALLIDFGSTFTKAVVADLAEERVVSSAKAPSTVDTDIRHGLASALEKLARDPQPLKSANKATAHLYIVNPLKGRGWASSLFSTHPPIEERIRRLRSM